MEEGREGAKSVVRREAKCRNSEQQQQQRQQRQRQRQKSSIEESRATPRSARAQSVSREGGRRILSHVHPCVLCVYVCMYIYMCVCLCVCVCVYVCVCVCVCLSSSLKSSADQRW
jgi:Flp pilus assembly protein TadB